MSWVERRIGDFVEIKHGYPFEGQYFTENGKFVVLTPGNCHENGGFKDKGEKEKFYAGPIPDGYILLERDLLVVMTDLISRAPVLGGSFFVPDSDRYLHNQRLGLVQISEPGIIDRTFLYYLFNSDVYRGQIRGSASGATVRHTSPSRIKACKVNIPSDVHEQVAIADILSAYDRLIENNRRRIFLLEQAARMLYREWFVHFRFPGHAHVKIINGLPTGWHRRALGEIALVKKGKNITKETIEHGNVPVVAGGLKPAYYHSQWNAVGPVITVSASGANAGHVALYYPNVWASDCSFISSSETARIWTLYLSLRERQAEITGMQQGAAQPHVYPKHLKHLMLPVAPTAIADLFEENVDASFCLIANLLRQNDALAQARDFLLPRLMNGEIAV